MDYLNSPVNKEEQLKRLIEDTEEILKSFKAISSLIEDKNDEQESNMYNLGSKIIHERNKVMDPNLNLGTQKIENII